MTFWTLPGLVIESSVRMRPPVVEESDRPTNSPPSDWVGNVIDDSVAMHLGGSFGTAAYSAPLTNSWPWFSSNAEPLAQCVLWRSAPFCMTTHAWPSGPGIFLAHGCGAACAAVGSASATAAAAPAPRTEMFRLLMSI